MPRREHDNARSSRQPTQGGSRSSWDSMNQPAVFVIECEQDLVREPRVDRRRMAGKGAQCAPHATVMGNLGLAAQALLDVITRRPAEHSVFVDRGEFLGQVGTGHGCRRVVRWHGVLLPGGGTPVPEDDAAPDASALSRR